MRARRRARGGGPPVLCPVAVGPALEPLQGGLDLGEQLALPVAGTQLDRPVGLRGGAVGEVGMILVLVLKMLQRLLRLLENVVLPRQQLVAKILALALVHEWLFVGRSIVLVLVQLRSGTVFVEARHGTVLVLVRTHGIPAHKRALLLARALYSAGGLWTITECVRRYRH